MAARPCEVPVCPSTLTIWRQVAQPILARGSLQGLFGGAFRGRTYLMAGKRRLKGGCGQDCPRHHMEDEP